MDEHRQPSRSARGTAARWWLVLALVLAVILTGTAVVLHAILGPTAPELAPASPTPTPTTAPTTAASRAEPGTPVVIRAGNGPLLPGTGTGEIYAQSATAIFRVELPTGRITRTPTPDLEEHVSFLAGPGWVLVKSRWSPTGVLVRDGRPASPLPQQFDPEGFLHAGQGGRLWVEPEWGTEPRVATTLQLAQLDGRPVVGRTVTAPRAAAPYAIEPDGYGGVLLTDRRGVYRLDPDRAGHPSRITLISRGDLIAAGGRRLLVWDCHTHARCQMVLVDQQTRQRARRPAAAAVLGAKGGIGLDRDAYGDEQLSPDGTHLAVMASDPTGTLRAHVIDLRDGRDTTLPGAGTDANANRQLAWSTNSRWLFALTDQQIRAYDTRVRTLANVPLGGERLLHLTTVNAPAW
ncbi:MAG TPA: hypothetical protein VGC37_18575 [Friedmanniella sp.]